MNSTDREGYAYVNTRTLGEVTEILYRSLDDLDSWLIVRSDGSEIILNRVDAKAYWRDPSLPLTGGGRKWL
jgi:hypothetical protein